MIAAQEPGSAADLAKALEKIKAAHYSFGTQQIAQWTLNDIPPYAEEPYVCMAAFLCASEFERPADPSWPAYALLELQRAANLPALNVTPAEYF